MTFKFYVWPRKTIGHLFCTTSSSVQRFKPIGEFKLQLQSRNTQFGSKLTIFCPIWPWNLMDDIDKQWASLLCYFKLCKSFQSHRWIQTGVTVRKWWVRSKSAIFVPCDLEISMMTLKNNTTPLLCYFKIWSSFHSHLWIWIGVTVRKIPILGQNRYFFL